METRRLVKGNHSRKTAAFVRACAAYCFIVIPSLEDTLAALDLYLLSGHVAIANGALSQGTVECTCVCWTWDIRTVVWVQTVPYFTDWIKLVVNLATISGIRSNFPCYCFVTWFLSTGYDSVIITIITNSRTVSGYPWMTMCTCVIVFN